MRAVASQANQQKVGLPSKLLGVLDAPVDARSGKVSISITPALERQVFAEYPAVAAMFAATVPHARSRKQFFEEFIKALRNRISRRRKKAAGAAPLPAAKEHQLLTGMPPMPPPLLPLFLFWMSGCLSIALPALPLIV